MTENNSLNGVRVAVLATDGFEEIELAEPRRALDQAGAQTTLIAPKGGTVYGMRHHDKAGQVRVELELKDAKRSDFDAVLLAGAAQCGHFTGREGCSGTCSRGRPKRNTHRRNLRRTLASCLGRPRKGPKADELLHDSGRYPECRRTIFQSSTGRCWRFLATAKHVLGPRDRCREHALATAPADTPRASSSLRPYSRRKL
jgi:DJ-1/PfpI family